jgi:MtN3 and saliva related transmembrane protein
MNWAIKLVDFIFAAGLFVNAMLFIPQAIRIYKNKHAKDLSLITFVGFVLSQLSAVIYGYLHHDYILAGGYVLALITCGTVTGLAFRYRYAKKEVKQE